MNIFRMFYNEFIRPTPKVKVGDIVKFQGYFKEIEGLVLKVNDDKSARIEYINYGSGKTFNTIKLKHLVIVRAFIS